MLIDELVEIVESETSEKKYSTRLHQRVRRSWTPGLWKTQKYNPMRSEFMLKLLFSSNQPKDQIIKMLEDYKQIHIRKLEKYLDMQHDLEQGLRK